MPNSRVVFDIANNGPRLDYGLRAGLLVMALIAVAGIVFRRVHVDAWLTRIGLGWLNRFGGVKSRIFNLIWGGGVLLLILISAVGYGTEWLRLGNSYRAGSGSVIAGCVTRFHPSSGLRGDDEEMVEIDGARFAYSDDIETPAFHQTALKGGPLRPDSWARITHVGNDIIKLEVADHACSPGKIDPDWRASS